MAKERPDNYLPPAVSYGALVVIVAFVFWLLFGGPTSLKDLGLEASSHDSDAPRFVAGPPEERWPNLTDEQWREVQGAGYRKRASFNGIFKGMSFDDLKEYQVWQNPEAVGDVDANGQQVLFYRSGFNGELIQLVFQDGRLAKAGCDPECYVSDLVRQRLGM